MLKPVKMQKVRIIGIKGILTTLIKELHESGFVEVNQIDYNAAGLETGRPLDTFNAVSEKLVRIRAIKSMLVLAPAMAQKKMPYVHGVDFEKEDVAMLGLEQELKKFIDDSTQLESELSKLQNELKAVDALAGFGKIDFSRLETNRLSYLVGELPKKNLDECKKKLEAKSHHYAIQLASENGGKSEKTHCLIMFQKGSITAEDLSDYGFARVAVPSYTTNPKETGALLQEQISKKKHMLTAMKETLEAVSKQHYEKVLTIENALSVESTRAEITSRFNFSKDTFVLEGWIKAHDYSKLEGIIAKHSPHAVADKLAANHHELPPTVLGNPNYAKPLQFITETFSLPNALEFDPTMIYLITLPLFYGMIVGDVLYGLLSIFLAKWFMKNFKNEMLVNAAGIWYLAAFPSILFGLIFDEWAGVSHAHWLEVLIQWGLPLVSLGIHGPIYNGLLERVSGFMQLLSITMYLGLAHLALAFGMAAVNEWGHSKKHSLAKIAWIGIEIGGTLVIASYVLLMTSVPQATFGLAGAGVLGISILLLILTEGFVGVLEVPGLMGNVLSYARIAVVGVSGVLLAELINEFLTPLPSQGIFALIMLPLFIILHAMNSFIAMFEALIQGGRLNIVEFRSKVLKGGGKMFEPFALR